MGTYEDQVLPLIIDVALGSKAMTTLRQHACAGRIGGVLEVGFGSGRKCSASPSKHDVQSAHERR